MKTILFVTIAVSASLGLNTSARQIATLSASSGFIATVANSSRAQAGASRDGLDSWGRVFDGRRYEWERQLRDADGFE